MTHMFSTPAALDRIAPGDAVVLWTWSPHAGMLNQAAAQKFGVNQGDPPPLGGWFGKDMKAKKWDGVVLEGARFHIYDMILADYSGEENKLRRFLNREAKWVVTSITFMKVHPARRQELLSAIDTALQRMLSASGIPASRRERNGRSSAVRADKLAEKRIDLKSWMRREDSPKSNTELSLRFRERIRPLKLPKILMDSIDTVSSQAHNARAPSEKRAEQKLNRHRTYVLHLLLTLICLASASPTLGTDEPAFTEEQKIAFLQHAKVIDSKPEKKGTSNASHLWLSDGTVTYEASFQPIDEKKAQGPGPNGGIELNFRDYWGYNIAGYRVAKLLGMDDMVPVYTERTWNGRTGAISWRVPNVQFDDADRYTHKIPVPAEFLDGWNRQMYKVRVLDELLYDMDTNLTNVLITKDWKIWRIDFTRAFRLHHELKDPKNLVKCDRQVLAGLRQLTYEQVLETTKPYLSQGEVKALLARRDKIVTYFDKLVAQKGESQVLY